MRLEQLTLDDLDTDQRELYDTIVGSRAGSTLPGRIVDEDGNLQGPFNAMLHYPELGLPLQELGGMLRFRGLLSPRARELVILIVAASWASEFEWWAHVRIGKHIGLTDDEIDAVRTSEPLALDDPTEQAAVDVARTTSRGDLDDDEYARAQDALGDRMLIEVLTLVGYYAPRIADARPPSAVAGGCRALICARLLTDRAVPPSLGPSACASQFPAVFILFVYLLRESERDPTDAQSRPPHPGRQVRPPRARS